VEIDDMQLGYMLVRVQAVQYL